MNDFNPVSNEPAMPNSEKSMRYLEEHIPELTQCAVTQTYERVVRASLNPGLQASVLQLEYGGVWVTFAFAPAKPLVWGEKWGEKAAATRLALPQAMRRNPQISTVALAAEVGMTSTSGVQKHVKALREAGCIRRVGPAKGGIWEVLEDV